MKEKWKMIRANQASGVAVGERLLRSVRGALGSDVLKTKKLRSVLDSGRLQTRNTNF